MAATHFENRKYKPIDGVDSVSCKPNFAVIAYPGYILSSPGSVASWQTTSASRQAQDRCSLSMQPMTTNQGAQPEQSLALYAAAREAGIDVELHIYGEGKHGFGVRKNGLPVAHWPGHFGGLDEETRNSAEVDQWYRERPVLTNLIEPTRNRVSASATELGDLNIHLILFADNGQAKGFARRPAKEICGERSHAQRFANAVDRNDHISIAEQRCRLVFPLVNPRDFQR